MDIQLKLYIDFDSGANLNYDVSSYLLNSPGISIERGKDGARIYSPPKAGRLITTLDNQSGLFSPDNVSSALFGLVRPGIAMRLKFAQYSDPLEIIWAGVLDDVTQDILNKRVGIAGLGNLSRLIGQSITTSSIITDTTGFIFGSSILSPLGLTRTGEDGLTNVDWWWSDAADAFSSMLALLATEGMGASIYETQIGEIAFRDRDHLFIASRSRTTQWTFSSIQTLAYSPDFKDVTNEATYSIVSRVAQGLGTLWELGERLTLAANEIRTYTVRGNDPFIEAVAPSTVPSDTIQTATPSATLTSGTYKLRFRDVTTAGTVAYNGTAAQWQTALEGLSTIGSGNVRCEGGPISTTPIDIHFIGIFAGLAITDLVEVVESNINPVTANATIEVTEEYRGDGILSEKQALRPSATLAGGGPFTITVANDAPPGGGTTGNIAYNASSATVQTAIRLLSGCGSFLVTGGPLSSGLPFIVNMIYATPLTLMTIGGTAVTAAVPSAQIDITSKMIGGVPDYILVSGAATFSIDRTSGISTTLTVTGGASGAVIDGLKVRARSVSVVSRSDVMSDSYSAGSIAKYGIKLFSPSGLPEISRTDAQTVANAFASFYREPRPSITIRVPSTTPEDTADMLALEIDDRVTIVNTSSGLNKDHWIETISHTFADNVVYSDFGCERASHTLLNDLMAFYQLDETSGVRYDRHHSYHLKDNNTVTNSGGAAQFMAANSEYLSIADNADLSMGDFDFTVDARVYLDTLPGGGALFPVLGKWVSGSGQEYILDYDGTSAAFRFVVSTTGSDAVGVTASTFGAASTGVWYYVRAEHDSVNNLLKISVNNGTANTQAHSTGVINGTSAFEIGRGAGSYFNGRMKSVGICKRLFTTAEKATRYAGDYPW